MSTLNVIDSHCETPQSGQGPLLSFPLTSPISPSLIPCSLKHDFHTLITSSAPQSSVFLACIALLPGLLLNTHNSQTRLVLSAKAGARLYPELRIAVRIGKLDNILRSAEVGYPTICTTLSCSLLPLQLHSNQLNERDHALTESGARAESFTLH